MSPGRSVVLIEDDEVLGASLAQRLRLEGVEARWARTLAEGEALLRAGPRPSLVLCDMRLPDGSGEDLITRLLPALGAVPVVAMTAYGGVDQAVRLMRAGADDYLTKPFPIEAVLDKLATLGATAAAAPEEAAGVQGEPGWRSAPMRALRAAILRLAEAEAPVLLTGESGAGKEVAARALHALGPRRGAPFVALNCAAIPRDLLESEVFGHEKGAFTGAATRRIGAAERAGEGTLLLDEVAELAPELQAKLLRLLEDRAFLRVGGDREIPLRARIVTATNADLKARVAEGRFRQDLYFRIAVVELVVPPLRDRPEDVLDLARHFLAGHARAHPTPLGLSEAAERALLGHAWPGNVRELRNRIERAAILAAGPVLEPADLFPDAAPDPGGAGEAASLAEVRDAAEREHIRRVLLRCGGRVQDAARALGIARTTLWEKMRRLGLGEAQSGGAAEKP